MSKHKSDEQKRILRAALSNLASVPYPLSLDAEENIVTAEIAIRRAIGLLDE